MNPGKSSLLRVLGTGFYIGMMTVGYAYNLTFIQIGLVDLAERQVGLSPTASAMQMTLLALMTVAAALLCGKWMNKRQPGFHIKLRIAFFIVLLQTILTPLALRVHSLSSLQVWIGMCALTLGIGIPITFSMAVDLVPRQWRGRTAAIITGSAYMLANLVPTGWSIEAFLQPLMWIMPLATVSLGILTSIDGHWLSPYPGQHRLPDFAIGRYAADGSKRLGILILLMFGVFFVDSLGFLRFLDTPRLMEDAWQATSLQPRLIIALAHLLTALIGGILYDALDVRTLFYWIYGIFALTHLMYSFNLRLDSPGAPLAMPMLYATAVSLYTVVNFALWSDLSTPANIGWNAALGVGLSGWTATFLSTALALQWKMQGIPLERHINIVDSLAFLCLLAIIAYALRSKSPSPWS